MARVEGSMVLVCQDSNFIGVWEDVLAAIGHALMIKFGLAREPSSEKTDEWVRLTRELIGKGYSQEEAGAVAAKKLFPDVGTRHYASQADTIALLLEQAGKK